MQRVSAFLPSWDKRTSSSGSQSNSNSNANANVNAGGANGNANSSTKTSSHSTTKSATGFFGWSNRTSTGSTRASVINGLSKINVNTANNRNSNAASLTSNGAGPNARVQREAFWPAPLDQECEKAARIIKSVCADGYLASLDDAASAPTDEPMTPIKVPKKIPKKIIQNAAGIAVFTCMRNGLWMTGSGGSGILIARKSDGTWSPPSGIMLHTPTLSFIIGVDVYDCVLVVNSLSALESITRPRVTLGEDVDMTSGPLVPVDSSGMETTINLKELGDTVLTYMKARGQEQVVNLNGCILTERTNENERFYDSSVTQMDVLSGNVSRYVEETHPLSEVIKMAEGRTDYDKTVIAKIAVEPAPGDATIASPNSTPHSPRRPFGVPQADDPDPFGILALEMAGMEIREAGTRLRPASSQHDFHARPPSSALSKKYRQSGDTFVTKSNRESVMSSRTVKSQMTDAYTQTDVGQTPETSPSPSRSENAEDQATFEKIPERRNHEGEEHQEVDYTTVDLTPLKHLSQPPAGELPVVLDAGSTTTTTQTQTRDSLKPPPKIEEEPERKSMTSSHYGGEAKEDDEDDDAELSNDDADDEDDEDDFDEEPVVFEVAAVQPQRTQAIASRMIHAKGNMVNIPKRIPPPLPTRNPARASMTNKSDISGDTHSLRSVSLHHKPSDSSLRADADSQKRSSTVGSTDDVPADQERKSSAVSEEIRLNVPDIKEEETETPQAEEKKPEEPEVDEAQDSKTQAEDTDKEENTPVAEKAQDDDDIDKLLAEVSKAEEPISEADIDQLLAEVSKPEESKADNTTIDDVKADDSKAAEPETKEAKPEEPVLETMPGSMIEDSESSPEESEAQDEKVQEPAVAPKSDEATAEESQAQDVDKAESETAASDDSTLVTEAMAEIDDHSDSNKKTRLSIDAGATDARSDFGQSSYTTPPTSDRHLSMDEDEDEETPKKLVQDLEKTPLSDEKNETTTANDSPAVGATTTT